MTLTPSTVFSPVKLGAITLPHRVAMAPLTRIRNNADHTPSEAATEYYSQRSAFPGTLIITEATPIHRSAGGLFNSPGVYTPEQIAGWKRTVDAVHANGSHIFLQLWAIGRAANSQALKIDGEGLDVVSASDIPFEGGETPRPLSEAEIKEYVGWYATAAKAFVEQAGGDGVEIHGANGYLIDQFLQTNSNNRTDSYGGSLENRARFLFQVVESVTGAVGADKTGIRLSPYSNFQGMKMDKKDRDETFSHVINQLKQLHPEFAYLHLVTPRANFTPTDAVEDDEFDKLAALWAPNTLLVAGGKEPKDAEADAKKYSNSVVVYGRHFISNPDLVSKIKFGAELTPYDRSTFYIPGPENTKGYTDYPTQYGPEGKL